MQEANLKTALRYLGAAMGEKDLVARMQDVRAELTAYRRPSTMQEPLSPEPERKQPKELSVSLDSTREELADWVAFWDPDGAIQRDDNPADWVQELQDLEYNEGYEVPHADLVMEAIKAYQDLRL